MIPVAKEINDYKLSNKIWIINLSAIVVVETGVHQNGRRVTERGWQLFSNLCT